MKHALSQLTPPARRHLRALLERTKTCAEANEQLADHCGVQEFFQTREECARCQDVLDAGPHVKENDARRAYGDYQTPLALAERACAHLATKGGEIRHVVEPTFGRGAFIVAALKHFDGLKTVCGVEIHAPYVWHTKFALFQFFQEHAERERPRVRLHGENVYDFDFEAVAEALPGGRVAVVGNPPWVTNAELGTLGADNLPEKHNFKQHSGLDALTGKSNFDVSEFILLMMLDAFGEREGRLAMLLKSGIIKTLVRDLPEYPYPLGALEALGIDAKKHFDASVDAALLSGRFGTDEPAHQCRVAELDAPEAPTRTFGWVEDKFVSDGARYDASARYDGASPMEWRQGLKHDCARVMELEPQSGEDLYENGLGENVQLEPDLVHALLKSSDLKQPVAEPARKAVIVPQRQVGRETEARLQAYPKLLDYLQRHREALDGRGSSIYDGKPPFSIFGIGDYAFRPFKVALSGFYKHPTFALVTPERGKPVMLDDTCYFLSFERLPDAVFTWALLNGRRVRDLLEALTFTDAKRPYTKGLLMRIDVARLADETTYDEIERSVKDEEGVSPEQITRRDWQAYGEGLRTDVPEKQLALF